MVIEFLLQSQSFVVQKSISAFELLKTRFNPLTTGVENECWLRGWKFFFQIWNKIQSSLEFKKMLSELRSLFCDMSRNFLQKIINLEEIRGKIRIEILKTDKNKHFRPKSIFDLLSYFQFQTDLFFVLSKNNR